MKTNSWLIKGIPHKKLNREKKKILKKYSSYIKMKSLYRIEILSPCGDDLGYIDCKSLKEVKDVLDDPMTSFNHSLIVGVYKKINSHNRTEIYTEVAGKVHKDLKKFSGKYVNR